MTKLPAMSSRLRAWGLLCLLVVMWGSGPALNKLAVTEIAPSIITAVRLIVATLLLLPVALARSGGGAWTGPHWIFFALSGLIGNALPYYLVSLGQTVVPSGVTTIFFAVGPLAVLVLANYFVPDERLTARRASGFLVGFVGIVVLVGPAIGAAIAGGSGILPFELGVLAAPLGFAINTILVRRRPACSGLMAAAGAMLMGSLMSLPVALWVGSTAAMPGATALAGLLGLAVIATALPTLLLYRLIDLAGPSFASLMSYLIPFWGVALAIVALGEPVPWRALAALPLILAGVVIAGRQTAPAGSTATRPRATPPSGAERMRKR